MSRHRPEKLYLDVLQQAALLNYVTGLGEKKDAVFPHVLHPGTFTFAIIHAGVAGCTVHSVDVGNQLKVRGGSLTLAGPHLNLPSPS